VRIAHHSRDHDTRWWNQDIICMIVQYLQDSGYTSSALTIQDEANVKMYEELEQRVQLKAMRKAILGILT
jgi:hypothetical protein